MRWERGGARYPGLGGVTFRPPTTTQLVTFYKKFSENRKVEE